MMPRVQWILEEIAAQDHELERVEKTGSIGAIQENSLTVKEIINCIHYKGPRTIKGLAKEITLSPEIVAVYIRYLAKNSKVKLKENRRRSDKIIELTFRPGGDIMPTF